ncbi:MAG TPA: FAD-dependent oxidoreductase, partial [Ramlibacter sp.]
MKIAIVGAGFVGVTTAWELTVDGHEVSVFDRRNSAAEESSFANAGVVAPGYVTPWAAPGMRGKALRSLVSTHGAVKLRWPLAFRDLGWMARFQRACTLEAYLQNRARLQRLAFYSRLRLHDIV